jgi:iron(III) transport system permease protein
MDKPWGHRRPRGGSIREPWMAAALITLVVALSVSAATANERTRPLLGNTLMLAAGSAVLSLPVATALALLIHRTNLRGRHLLQMLITLMLFVPPYLQVAFWQAGFGLQGWFCRLWYPDQAVALLSGWRGAIWVQTLVNIPWVVLILGSSLTSIPAELEERASLDASPLRVLWHVTIPLLRPALVASALAVFVLAAGDITVTDIYQIRTFAEEIYTGFALGDQLSDVPLRTLPGMLLIGGLALAALLACGQVSRSRLTSARRRGWRADLGPVAWAVWPVLAVVLITLVVVPIGSLLYQAGMEVTLVGPTRVRHWSPAKAVHMLVTSPVRFGQEYAWSFALAQLTSISVILTAIVLAWAGRTWSLIRAVGWCVVLSGLALPGPLVALALGRALNRPNWDWTFYLYDRTLLLPWATLSLRMFPFAYLVVDFMIRRIPQRTLDLARTEGASPVQRFRLAVWPHCGPAIGWLWLVLVAFAVADLSATILAVPPGVTTVAIRIFNLVHYGVADQLAGLCLGTVVLFGLLASLVIALWPWQAEPHDVEL